MKKQNVRTLSLIVGTFTYLLIGAAIFDAIESEEEKRHKEALEKLESQMLKRYQITDDDFDILEEVVQLQQPYKAGKPWKFAGSFYYATTVLTTIGYGHSTPKTDGGKMFTMIYAIIGIPIGLVMFNSIGERFNYFASMIINKFRKMIKAKQEETTEMDLIAVGLSLSLIVFTCGAAAFSHYEGWTYYHSMYYCFTTLTTIGFGDFVALQQDNALEKNPQYVTFALFFIMFGLAIIAALLNLMVLKFMTMNTEDEKKDEAQALQNAAQTVRLDGDIICQQNEIRPWQGETGSGSMDDVRSVCSCTALTCDPFHIKAKRQRRRLKKGRRRKGSFEETEETLPGTRCSTTMKWYSTDSLHTARSPIRQSTTVVQNCEMTTRVVVNAKTVTNCKNGKKAKSNSTAVAKANKQNSEKAGSVHDLRRFAVSSLLKVPPQYTTFNEPQRQPFRLQDHQQPMMAAAREQDLIQSSNQEEEPKFVLVNSLKVSKFFKAAKCWTLQSNRHNYHDDQDDDTFNADHEDFPLEDMQATDRQKRASL